MRYFTHSNSWPKLLIGFSVLGSVLLYIIWVLLRCVSPGSNNQLELKTLLNRQFVLQKRLQKLAENIKIGDKYDKDIPMIYAITPTYKRATQKADLTRISQTFLHISNFHWIVVEDSIEKTLLVQKFLKKCRLKYTHLAIKTQDDLIRKAKDPRWKRHRGVDQRNLGLKWIRDNIKDDNGVVYFADDDNTYDLQLFKEMRNTNTVSIWPVALVGGLKWEGPVCVYGKVINFFTAWQPQREFPVDMASFAISLKLILGHKDVYIDPDVKRGYLESDFLSNFKIKRKDLEPKADNCRTILVWHTQTSEPNMKQERRLAALGQQSDPSIEI